MVYHESSSEADLEELELEDIEEDRSDRLVKEEGALCAASLRREKIKGYKMKKDRSRVTWDKNSTLELITQMVAYEIDCRQLEGSDANGKEWSRRYKRWETIAKTMKNPRGHDLEKLRKSCQARFTSLCVLYRGKNVNKKRKILNGPTLRKLTEYFNLFPASRFKQPEEDVAVMVGDGGEELPRRKRGRPRKTPVAVTEGPKTGNISIEPRKIGSASGAQNPVKRLLPMPVQIHEESVTIRRMEATICWLRSWVKVNILPILNDLTVPSMSDKELRRMHEECSKLQTDQLNEYLVEARSGYPEYIEEDTVPMKALPNLKDQLSVEILKIAAAVAKVEDRLDKLEDPSGVRQVEIRAPFATSTPVARPAPIAIPADESPSLVASTSAVECAPPGHTVNFKFC